MKRTPKGYAIDLKTFVKSHVANSSETVTATECELELWTIAHAQEERMAELTRTVSHYHDLTEKQHNDLDGATMHQAAQWLAAYQVAKESAETKLVELLNAAKWAIRQIGRPILVKGQNDEHFANYAKSQAAIANAEK